MHLSLLRVSLSVLSLAILYKVLRMYIAGTACTSTARMDSKTVIITGANTGIGKETALELAMRGARVIMACRDLTKGEAARKEIVARTGNRRVVLKHVDLASLSSVRKFAEDINKNEAKLDVLINNAGVAYLPDLQRTQDGFEMTMGVNHFGPFLLTNLLLGLLKQSPSARIVVVSSVTHSWLYKKPSFDFDKYINNIEVLYDRFEAYGCSKLANILFTRELSKRLKGTNVTANSLHPGVVMTDLGRHMRTSSWYVIIVEPILTCLFKTAKEGAQTTIHLAVSEEVHGLSGLYFAECAPTEPSEAAQDDDAATKLWEISEKLVGIAHNASRKNNRNEV